MKSLGINVNVNYTCLLSVVFVCVCVFVKDLRLERGFRIKKWERESRERDID